MTKDLTILIFKSDESICYGLLEAFSEQLRDAFIKVGENVEYVDPAQASIEDYVGRKFKAVIAVMETLFYSSFPDTGKRVFDYIEGPKINIWFDHPVFYYMYVKKAPKDYYILTQDRDYVAFINKNFGGNAKAFYLPPGGKKSDGKILFKERKYNLSFVGVYGDWEDAVKSFNMEDETTRIIVYRYLDKLVSEPELTTEAAYEAVLSELGASYSDEEFVQGLATIHKLAMGGVAKMFREEIVRTIIENGIVIDVFGDSWKKAPFSDNPNLRIHPSVSYHEINDIYEDSRMILNVMTWHKDAITERVLDAMMAGCIVISDETPALRECFSEGKEIVLFSLREIEKLPDLIRQNMDNEAMASAGRDRAMSEHSWESRARELLRIIDSL
jgi:glycosyltransferase involved in cell wall biosynthesis